MCSEGSALLLQLTDTREADGPSPTPSSLEALLRYPRPELDSAAGPNPLPFATSPARFRRPGPAEGLGALRLETSF